MVPPYCALRSLGRSRAFPYTPKRHEDLISAITGFPEGFYLADAKLFRPRSTFLPLAQPCQRLRRFPYTVPRVKKKKKVVVAASVTWWIRGHKERIS